MRELLAILPGSTPKNLRKTRPRMSPEAIAKSVEGKRASYKKMSMKVRERNHAALRRLGVPSNAQAVANVLGMSRTAMYKHMSVDEALVRIRAVNDLGKAVILYWFKE